MSSSLTETLARLSPQQRKLLERRLQQKGIEIERFHITPRAQDRESYPLSFAQQRLWFLYRLEPDSTVYHVVTPKRLEGVIEPRWLRGAVNAVIARHEALRTVFGSADDGLPEQRVLPSLRLEMPVVDLSALPALLRERMAPALTRRFNQRPFVLETGPLLRVALLRHRQTDHVVLISMHHIVSDGWSLGILFSELMSFYATLERGGTAASAPLAPLPIQYPDYAVWQREWLAREVMGEQLGYWRQQLRGLPVVLEMPLDRPRPPMQAYEAGTLTIGWSPAMLDRLRLLARQEKTTLFVVLLAAWQTLLYRWTGADDVAVGSPIAGRNRQEIEGLIGFFVNTLVLRLEFADRPSFRDMVNRAREVNAGANSHQDLPFERLVDELQPERSMQHNPLFQVSFSFQNDPAAAALAGTADGMAQRPLPPGAGAAPSGSAGAKAPAGGIGVRAQAGGNPVAMFDLSLLVEELPQRLAGTLVYGLALFDRTSMLRLARRLVRLLEAACAQPDIPVERLALLSGVERQQLLCEWNDTAATALDRGADGSVDLPGLFEQSARRFPDRVAVSFDGRSLSYAELDRRSSRLAQELARGGAGPETPVGICGERSLELVIGLLAIVRAGAAYLPLDPDYPAERLAFMLEQSGAPVLAVQEHLRDSLPADALAAQRRTVALTPDSGAGGPTVEAGRRSQHPLAAAYVIFTSGSTGQPKGVVNCHRAIVNRLLWMQDAYRLGSDDRVLQKTPFSFDVSVWEFFWPLAVGAELVVAEPGGHQDASYLANFIQRRRITTLHFVPSMLSAFLQAPELNVAAPWRNSLRRVICSGEALAPETVRRFADRFAREAAGEPQLHNLYGPTEAAIDVTAWPVRPDGALHALTIPIGRPIGNLQVHVFERGGGAAPIGVPGELLIGGVGLARGYLARPALTADRFVPDSTGAADGDRLYRTGDLVRRRQDGAIEFLGRIDHQVKVRGFRIELGEIEAALAEAPEVRETVVLARQDEPGHTRLVAYLVLDSDDGTDGISARTVHALRQRLGERLPSYMIPAFFVPLEQMPLSPNGKVDRRALPAPVADRSAVESAFVAPSTPVEQALAEIWMRLLSAERVGVEDAFFELGGDSILALQMISRAARAGIKLQPRQVFQYPTIRRLAAVAEIVETVEIDQGPVHGPVPLTPVQRWFLDSSPASPEHFNQAVMLAVPAEFQRSALQVALARLMVHHDILRLRLARDPESAAGWRQWIEPPDGGDPAVAVLRFADFSNLQPAQVPGQLTALGDRLHTSFRFGAGPLLRVVHVELGGGQAGRLLLVAHHLLVDAVSWRILVEDFEELYRAAASGREAQLPTKTTSYQAWSEALLAAAQGGAFGAELDHWRAVSKSVSGGASEPAPEANEAPLEATTRRCGLKLSSEVTGQLLRDVPPVYRTRIQEVLLTALASAVRRWRGAEVMTVELEGHGREPFADHLDVSRTVGWFTTIAPAVLDLGGEEDPGERLKRVKEQLRAAPPSAVGYGALRYLAGEPSLAELPPAEILFNYLGQIDAGAQELQPEAANPAAPPAADASAAPSPAAVAAAPPAVTGFLRAPEATGIWVAPEQRRRYLLGVSGQIAGGRLGLELDYSEAQFDRETMQRLLESIRGELEALVEHCLSPGAGGFTPSDFPLAKIDQATVDRLVAEYPQAENIYPLTSTQQGMLFYGLFDRTSAAYTNQTSRRFDGDFDPEAFRRAWHDVIQHREILRACVRWEGLAEPLQIIHRQVEVPWEILDWRDVPADQQEARLKRYVAVDRAQGFELTRAPVMRLALIQLADDAWFFNWNYHHMLLDGWSVPLLRNEVSERYMAHCLGIDPKIEPERPFHEYIEWLAAQDMSEAEAFWRRDLAGFDEPISLGRQPATTKPKREAERFASFGARLSMPTTEALRTLAGRHNLTVNTLAQTAWAITLAHLAGRDDVLFGTTVSGRSAGIDGMETMLGPFLNTLASRARIDRSQPLVEWARDFQVHQVTARQFEHTPVNDVHRWSEVPPTRLLFESILVFENYPQEHSFGDAPPTAVEEALELAGSAGGLPPAAGLAVAQATGPKANPAGVQVQSSEVRFVERTSYPITLVMVPDKWLMFSIAYDLRVFDRVSAWRLLETLRRALEAIVAHPELPIGELPLYTQEEQTQVLRAGNQTLAPFEEEALVSELIARQAAERPDAVAVVQGEVCWSYRELRRRSLALAARLRSSAAGGAAIGLEERVAILSERSPAMVAAILAVMEAGGTYLPIDPKTPPARLRFVVEDSGVRLLLASRSLAAVLPAEMPEGVTLSYLDDAMDPALGTSPASTLPEAVATPASLAYVIYTSGSSGTPKGVMISHRSLSHFAVTSAEEAGIGPGSRVLQFASLSFDTSVEEIFPCLCSGGRLVLRDDDMLRFDRLLTACDEQRIEVLDLPTAYWHELTAEMERTGLRPSPSLRLVILGGEKALAPVLEQWKRMVPPTVALVNTYGPTETTVVATRVPVVPALPGVAESAEIPIGTPRPNTRCYVLDPHREPVLGGIPGELWIGGEGVARGYLDRPALTAERFRPDPYGAALEGLAPGGRLYRTGDRVRLGEIGMLEFLGRIDQQVKVRGFRIEPEEIESALAALSGVREAAVKPVERDGEPLRLAAFVVFEASASGGVSQPMEVKERLAEELPDYMVPHWIVSIEALPKTASGKIDRRALPEPLEDRDAAARVAPRTPAEQVLLEIFQELFDRPEVGVEAGFFDLGGDSLLALRLMSRVQDRLNRDLPLTLLFEKSTIAELAEALSEGGSAATGGSSASGRVALPLVVVQPRGDEAPFFCVHPAGGNVLCYNPLGQALGIDRPFYGFQAPGLLREREPILGVEPLARHYVRALRKKQPAGPIHLGGWSTGGVVAFEMARQLEALGERPATLVLFDTLAPSAFPVWSEIELVVAFAGSQEVGFPAGGEISLARFASMARAEQLALIAERRRQAGSLAAEAGVEEVVAQWRVFSANVRSLKRYEPERYGGDVLCFRALERGANADIAEPWAELAAQVDVEEVPGNHESMMFKPHVQVLARRLGQRLSG